MILVFDFVSLTLWLFCVLYVTVWAI